MRFLTSSGTASSASSSRGSSISRSATPAAPRGCRAPTTSSSRATAPTSGTSTRSCTSISCSARRGESQDRRDHRWAMPPHPRHDQYQPLQARPAAPQDELVRLAEAEAAPSSRPTSADRSSVRRRRRDRLGPELGEEAAGLGVPRLDRQRALELRDRLRSRPAASSTIARLTWAMARPGSSSRACRFSRSAAARSPLSWRPRPARRETRRRQGEADRLLVAPHRGARLVPPHERIPQVEVRIGEGGPEPDRLAIGGDERLLVSALADRAPQVRMRLPVARLDGDGLAEVGMASAARPCVRST